MALFYDEKYYSARQAFIESQYGDWEAYAENVFGSVRLQENSGMILRSG